MRADILDTTDETWHAFVDANASASIFHHPVWSQLLADCYGSKPFALVMRDSGGDILAGTPVIEVGPPLRRRRWVSLPFTDYCAPLISDGSDISKLTETFAQEILARGLRSLELRAELPEGPGLFELPRGFRHATELQRDADKLFATFSKKHRRNVRTAERGGVEIRRGNTQAEMDIFYDLHLMTRRRLGVPIQPSRFFGLITERIMAQDLGWILAAYLDDTPVAAAVFFEYNGVLVYKFAASDPRYSRHCPNHLLLWTALQWACRNDFRTFDWGRTDPDAQGLRDFKSGWGAVERPLLYSLISKAAPSPSSGRLKKMAGAIIRRSPAWVCRSIGELLYKYAA